MTSNTGDPTGKKDFKSNARFRSATSFCLLSSMSESEWEKSVPWPESVEAPLLNDFFPLGRPPDATARLFSKASLSCSNEAQASSRNLILSSKYEPLNPDAQLQIYSSFYVSESIGRVGNPYSWKFSS